MKRAAVITIGCRLNQSEGDALRTFLQKQGNQVVSKIYDIDQDSEHSQTNRLINERLDTVFINTCAVTERATNTSIKWVRRFAKLKPKPILVVTGCLAQNEVERIVCIKGVDRVITQSDKLRLIELCPILPSRTRAFLKIQDGCLNRCAYCLPAKIRGEPVSKPISIVEQEVKDLVQKDYQEIILVGLNLGVYGLDVGISLVTLLEKLSKIKGEFRIRLSSLEPDVFDEKILERFEEFHLCRHFHIPLQSGDDKILNLMGRKYTLVQYQRLIDKLTNRIPDINIGTDLIVGYPAEDELSFDHTLNYIRDLPLSYMHVFPYSPRPGTKAFSIPETVNQKKKKERVKILRELSKNKSFYYRQKFLNKVLRVINEPNSLAVSDNYIRIFITGFSWGKITGKLAETLITSVTMDRTIGEILHLVDNN